jgi:argininosuccinate lyase
MFHDAARTLTLVGAALGSASFNVAGLERRASENWVTITELADTLVREHGLAFDTAHGIASRVVAARTADPQARIADVVARAARELAGVTIVYTDEQMAAILSPQHFVAVRTTLGGPAPAVTTLAIEASRKLLASDMAWIAQTRERLDAAVAECRERSLRL